MRVGILSDIHGNLAALEKAIAVLDTKRINVLVSAGDAIGYGPYPNECIDVLRDHSAVAVLGNHELHVLGRAEDHHYSARALRTLHWTKSQLGADQRQWLTNQPSAVEMGPMVVAHGSLDSPHEYVVRPRQVDRQFELLQRTHGDARILILGHTHFPFLRVQGRRWTIPPLARQRFPRGRRILVNPGSVGQSRQWEWSPRVRFAILDLDRSRISWFAVPYDHQRTRDALTAAALPRSAMHLRPSPWHAVKRWLRTLTDVRAAGVLPWKRPQ
ncbi:MAG: metallophosphatase family protein [Chloroflexi bacterium]|nr:metallophosphatase family protein [Chloroflexota bacterium]